MAAGAALMTVAATGASAATPLTVTYNGTLSGTNTTYNQPFDVAVILTGQTTEEDASDGAFGFSNFTANYGGDVATLNNVSAAFVGNLFRISVGGVTFADFTFTSGSTAFATGTDYAATLSGGGPIDGTFGTAVISGGAGILRGDLNVAAVPEPAGWALMLLGFGAVGVAMRRRSGIATHVRYA